MAPQDEDRPPPFLSLPPEVCHQIVADLTNGDIKKLRLACRFLNANCTLRFPRVFISANPVNLRVAHCIADLDDYRRQVTEIVWDDARLPKPKPLRTSAYRDISWSDEDDCPKWFARECRENLERLEEYTERDVDRPAIVERRRQLANLMSLPDAWMAFLHLRFQEKRVVETQADIQAFRHVLSKCPVRTVTITPSAHGHIFTPLYKTPMIRSFPTGFNHAIPRGWPSQWDYVSPGGPGVSRTSWRETREKTKDRWRGFRIVTRVLAEEAQHHQVVELRINVFGLTLGLNSRIFDAPCDELTNLAALLARPGFRRLDLSLQVGGAMESGWRCYRSGLLAEALQRAVDMEHFALYTDVVEESDDGWSEENDLMPLGELFPVDKWPRLRHFGLSRFLVTQDALVAFLACLPDTVRSVELSNLEFIDDTTYMDLVELMRDTLPWRDRAPEARPRVSITTETYSEPVPGRQVWLDADVYSFLYEGGDNPFDDSSHLFMGKGIYVDEFDDSYTRPFLNNLSLAKLGITSPEGWERTQMGGITQGGYAQADTDEELYEMPEGEYPEGITEEMRERHRARVRQREALQYGLGPSTMT